MMHGQKNIKFAVRYFLSDNFACCFMWNQEVWHVRYVWHVWGTL